jgi:predicted membrane channel-forming protein YqfA (hemolysin III family)
MYYGEKLNSISHLVGAVLALVGFGALLAIGIQEANLQAARSRRDLPADRRDLYALHAA